MRSYRGPVKDYSEKDEKANKRGEITIKKWLDRLGLVTHDGIEADIAYEEDDEIHFVEVETAKPKRWPLNVDWPHGTVHVLERKQHFWLPSDTNVNHFVVIRKDQRRAGFIWDARLRLYAPNLFWCRNSVVDGYVFEIPAEEFYWFDPVKHELLSLSCFDKSGVVLPAKPFTWPIPLDSLKTLNGPGQRLARY